MSTDTRHPLTSERSELDAFELFQGLDPEKKAELIRHFEVLDLPSGQTVIQESQTAQAFFAIVSGSLAVYRDAVGQPVNLLARLGPGDFFGELGIFGSGIYSASVRTTEACRLLKIEKETFLDLLRDQAEILQQLQQAAARRHADNVAKTLEMGRRREVRIRCGNRARLISPEEDRQVVVDNLSVGGACLREAPESWQVGEERAFEIAIREVLLPLTAEVVWRQGDTVGLHFIRRSENHDMILQMAIRLLLESAS